MRTSTTIVLSAVYSLGCRSVITMPTAEMTMSSPRTSHLRAQTMCRICMAVIALSLELLSLSQKRDSFT